MKYFILFFLIANVVFANVSTLKNGAPLYYEVDKSLPRQLLVITFEGGGGLIPKELQGLDWILTEILQEGSKKLAGDAYRKKLFLLNSDIYFSRKPRALNVLIKTPEKNLREVLNLFYDVITHPNLTSETFNRVKEQVLNARAVSDNEMRSVTFYYAPRDVFKYHPDTLDSTGSLNSIKNITFEKINEYYPKIINFNMAFYNTLGKAKESFVKNEINRAFFKKDGGKFSDYPFKSILAKDYISKGIKATIINKTSAVDNQVLFVYPFDFKLDTKKYLIGLVTHQILGGGLDGKLGSTLRGERGLTYHAQSSMSRKLPDWFVYTFGGVTQTLPLLNGAKEIINKFKEETITLETFDKAIGSIITDHKADFELPQDILFERIGCKLNNLDDKFVIDDFLKNLKSVTLDDVMEFKKINLDNDNGYLYLMGDKDKLLKIVKEYGIAEKEVRVVEISGIM